MAEPFKLYNTLSKENEDFKPIEAGKVGLYVCGMTVYDHIHVGHARAMVTFDAFVRYLRHRSWDVHFVRNFTDVDDKIINRANEKEKDPFELAQYYIDSFHEDTDALGLIKPDAEPRVTTSMDDIIDMIVKLVDKGHAYQADGSVWFSVKTHNAYGKLSRQNVDELRSADEVSGKKDAADFALWKIAKEGEPSWESPWGNGRPGWHIECSAMADKLLGTNFDIHGGGLDLVFPHHENEIAQSECANGAAYANYWMHNGLLTMTSGQKMGKSLGNVINVRKALETFPAETLRIYYLQNHYRSALPWDENALPEALGMLARLYEARENAQEMGGQEEAQKVVDDCGQEAKEVFELGTTFKARFYEAMDSDFGTGTSLGYLFRLARAVNRFAGHKKAKKRGGPVVAPALAAFDLMRDALGLMQMSSAEFHTEVKAKRLVALGLEQSTIEGLIEERTQARLNKDWGKADELRETLESKGIMVMDSRDGVTWRVKL